MINDKKMTETAESPLYDMGFIMDCKSVYDDITHEFPIQLGKAASKREREEQRSTDTNLVYGEITFESLGIVFEKIKTKYGLPNIGSSGPDGVMQSRGGIFYDLGSGIGKPVIAAAILFNFDFCCGIEILEGLCSVSVDLIETYNSRSKIHPTLFSRPHSTHCQTIHSNFLHVKRKDWKDGDIIFVNSTCFDDKMMEKIGKLAARLKKGVFLITLTKRLTSKDFVVVDYGMYPMSWGEATIYIMQKTSDREINETEDDSDEEDS